VEDRAEHRKAGKLEWALYVEMGEIYLSLRRLLLERKKPDSIAASLPDDVMANIIKGYCVTDAFKFAKSNPDSFYSLKKAYGINQAYAQLNDIHTIPIGKSDFAIIIAEAFCEEVRNVEFRGTINRKLFAEANPEAFEELQHHKKQYLVDWNNRIFESLKAKSHSSQTQK
jgi:hypothetical protein